MPFFNHIDHGCRRGRVATAAAFVHLGLSVPRGTGAAPAPGSLFEGNPE